MKKLSKQFEEILPKESNHYYLDKLLKAVKERDAFVVGEDVNYPVSDTAFGFEGEIRMASNTSVNVEKANQRQRQKESL